MAELRKSLGVAGLTFYGVGMIVGAGVYSVVGAGAGMAGEALWLAFALGAAVATLTALSYAELAAMLPHAGAEYVYVRTAMPGTTAFSFVVGVVLSMAAAGTAATVSLAFGGYLGKFVAIPPWAAALGLVAAATAVNVFGVKLSSRVNVVFTILETAGLVAFIVAGATHPEFGAAIGATPGPGVLGAAALLFFAYLGFEDVVNLAEEAKDPARDVPRALFVSLAVTAVLYVGVGLAAVALLSPEALAGSKSPLSDAADSVSPALGGALGGIALFATANTALIALVAGSRLLFGMAREGDVPAVLSRVSKKGGAPLGAAIGLGIAAAALVPLGDVAIVAGLSSFAALSAFVAVNASLVVLRYRAPRRRRPFRVPGSIGRLPLLPVLALATAAGLLTQFDRATYVGGGIAIGAALVLWVVFLRRRRRR